MRNFWFILFGFLLFSVEGVVTRRIRDSDFVIEFFNSPEIKNNRLIIEGKGRVEIEQEIITDFLQLPILEDFSDYIKAAGFLPEEYITDFFTLGAVWDESYWSNFKERLLNELLIKELTNLGKTLAIEEDILAIDETEINTYSERFTEANLAKAQNALQAIINWRPSILEYELLYYLTPLQARSLIYPVVKTIIFKDPRFEDYNAYRYANQISHQTMMEVIRDFILPSLKEKQGKARLQYLSKMVVAAGVSSIKSKEDLKQFMLEAKNREFAISSFDKFYAEFIQDNPKKRLLYFFDNNGELDMDLLYIKELLNANPNLAIIGVAKENQIEQDVSVADLAKSSLEPEFQNLIHDKRFGILRIDTTIQGIDGKKISQELVEVLKNSDGAIFKGEGNFRSTQGFNINRFYLLLVKHLVAAMGTGLSRERLEFIFAKVKAGIIISRDYTLVNYSQDNPGDFDIYPE